MVFEAMLLWFAAQTPASTGTRPVHDVVAGETLGTVAADHGCSVSALRRANPEVRELIRIGQVIVLPPACRVDARRDRMVPATLSKPRSARPPSVAARSLPSLTDLPALPRSGARSQPEADGVEVVKPKAAAIYAHLPPPPRGDAPDDRSDEHADGRSSEPASLGRPNGGRLVGGIALPHDRAYYLRRPERAYGLPHVVRLTHEAISGVRRRYPRLHRLAIGDLSRELGGFLPGHRSHQSGRDVDIGLYFERAPRRYPREFVAATQGRLHHAALWALIEAFYRQSKLPGGPQVIFLDYGLQGELVRWARRHRVSRQLLEQVFQYPHGRRDRKAFVRHEPAHDDHMHVRFACAPRDRACR